MGREAEALDLVARCLEICREFNDEGQHVESQVDLAAIYTNQGRHPQALTELETAYEVAQRLASPHLELVCLNHLGQALIAAGRPTEALARHRAALAIAWRIGDRYQLACALDGIAHAQHDVGQTAPARRHWANALAIFTELGVPEAERVRIRLADAV
jgi:tetratricopeptide (TPR) repeat protein